MTTIRTSRLALAFAGAAFLAAACASIAAEPAKPAASAEWTAKNLKILPADMPRPQVIAVMQGFTKALGVDCSFCHANGTDGKLDPSSDAKKEKAAARWMMTMVRDLNGKMGVKDMNQAKVTCFTCHRGAAHPLTKPLEPGEKPKDHVH